MFGISDVTTVNKALNFLNLNPLFCFSLHPSLNWSQALSFPTPSLVSPSLATTFPSQLPRWEGSYTNWMNKNTKNFLNFRRLHRPPSKPPIFKDCQQDTKLQLLGTLESHPILKTTLGKNYCIIIGLVDFKKTLYKRCWAFCLLNLLTFCQCCRA